MRTFYDAYVEVTDYGACCQILPYLNFANPETVHLSPDNYTAKHWHSLPKGAKNGKLGGIKFLLDVESFDFYYTGKDTQGFRIAFTDQRDTATVKQNGYVIPTGEFSK